MTRPYVAHSRRLRDDARHAFGVPAGPGVGRRRRAGRLRARRRPRAVPPSATRPRSAPFNAALAPGPKEFDASLSEFSITDQRKAAVDFSSPYFDVTQAVVTVKSSPAAKVRNIDGLKRLRLGVQVGSTSYTAATACTASSRSPSTTPTATRRRR
jgi:hypothetical protein